VCAPSGCRRRRRLASALTSGRARRRRWASALTNKWAPETEETESGERPKRTPETEETGERFDKRTPETEETGECFNKRVPETEETESGERFEKRAPEREVTELGEHFDECTPETEETESGERFNKRAPETEETESGERFDKRAPETEETELGMRPKRTPETEETGERFDKRTLKTEETGKCFNKRTPETEETGERSIKWALETEETKLGVHSVSVRRSFAARHNDCDSQIYLSPVTICGVLVILWQGCKIVEYSWFSGFRVSGVRVLGYANSRNLTGWSLWASVYICLRILATRIIRVIASSDTAACSDTKDQNPYNYISTFCNFLTCKRPSATHQKLKCLSTPTNKRESAPH